jgi:hypothetical protein
VGKPAVARKLKAARERDFVSGFTSEAETGDYVNKCEQMRTNAMPAMVSGIILHQLVIMSFEIGES